VLDHLEERYASESDVTVEEVECLAACDGAPALQVNYEFHERVSPDSAEDIVESYRSGARRARTVSGATVA
jgi:NADH-quinone oxidoreductase subunit E